MEEGTPSREYLGILAERRMALARELDAALDGATEFVWELGSGHGHFLAAYAAAHPTVCCIGVDIVSERIERARRKRDRARLTNLHFLRTEGRLFLETLPPTTRIRDAFILFPDPWPKSRHHKHRIIQPSFLHQLASHATFDCRLIFRTDFAPYFEAARATVTANDQWKLTDEPWPFEAETVFQNRAPTHHSLVARRRPSFPPAISPPAQKDVEP